jgi:hypothetical protein
MNFEALVKDIKKLYNSLSGKDVDVILTYRGTSYGLETPWLLRCDSREIVHKNHEEAALQMFEMLKKELAHKAMSLESQATEYRRTLNSFAS